MDRDALTARIASGRTDHVHELIALPAPWPLFEGASPLQWCAYYGDVSALRLLLANGAGLHELGRDFGLNGAAFHGHWRLCEFLLERGAQVGYADPATGETALHSAVMHEDRARQERVVTVLLRGGANPNARTKPGVVTGAVMRDGRTMGETPLHRAAAFGGVATIRRLIEAGADVTSVDDRGDSPLAWASWHRRPVEVLRVLLHGAHRIHDQHRSMHEHLLGSP